MDALPAICETIGIKKESLTLDVEGIKLLGYESKFCDPTNAKLNSASADALFLNICAAGNTPICRGKLNGIKDEQKPLALFNCGVTRLYSNVTSRTPAFNSVLGPSKPGKPPQLFTNKLNNAVTTARANQASAGQQGATLAEIQANFSKICFACGLVSRLYTTSIVYGEAVTAAIGREVVKLMGIGLALYMVFVAAKLFFPFGPQDKMVGLGNKLSISLMITVALSFLYLTDASYKFYWNYVYNPIVDAAINMNDQLLDEGSGDGTFFGRLNGQNIVCGNPDLAGADSLTEEQNISRNKLQCQVHKMQYVFTYGLATGIYILLQGSWISGGALIAIYAFAPLVFAFAIIDALMRWTFISILSPILMACGCFPTTRKYAYLGVRVMLEAAISFVVVAVIAVIISGMMEQSLSALNYKFGQKNLPAWLEKTVKIPPLPPSSPTPTPTPSLTPPVTMPDTPATTGQLENGAAVVATTGFDDSYQGDGEQDYATTLLSGMMDRETVDFPPQYPQRTTLTEAGMRAVYEDRALAGAVNLATGICGGRTGKYITMVPSGGEFYTLRLIENGVVKGSVTVVSGRPDLKPVERSKDYSGSKRPVPQGVIRIGNVDRNNKGDWAGVGDIWIPFNDADTSPRAAVGFHLDNNRASAPGTAGCIAAIDKAGIQTIANWVEGGAKTLIVDHGLQENKPSCSGGLGPGTPPPSASGGSFSCKVRPTSGTETSQYGWRWGKRHNGLDIAPSAGTPIVATDAGKVFRVCHNQGVCQGYGNNVVISHAGGWYTTYSHMLDGSIAVTQGATVSAGQLLGRVGSTGFSTGPHLHFEVLNGCTSGYASGKQSVGCSTDQKICLSGAAMPNGAFSDVGVTADGAPAADLFNAPAYDYADADFMILCAAGLLAGFLMKNFSNIGAQFLGGQTFGVSSSGALSNMAAAGAQWVGALGGAGLGFARNALTPTTANPSGNNPVSDLMRKADDYLTENSDAYNRAKEFIDDAKTTIENNQVVKGATDKIDELKAGLEAFSQSRAGRVTDAALSGAAAVAGVGAGALGVAATGIVSMTENLAMQQAMRVLEATGYGEIAGAIGGGLAQGVGTGMSWVPEKRTVFINRDVVKHYVAMQGLIRDAEERVQQKTAELAAMDDAADKSARDRIAHELVQATTELRLLGIAATFDVTGRNNRTLTGILESARQGASGDFRDIESRIKSFERMLKQDTENVRYTPEIEKAIIAASMKGFANKQSPTVAGYTQINTESVDDTLRGTSADVAGLATKDSAKTTTQITNTERQAAFAALGLKEGATEEEMKKARKDIMKEIALAGASVANSAVNDARLRAMNQAYDLLSKERQEKLDANKGYRDAAGNSIDQPTAGHARTGTLALAAAKEPELKGLQKVAGYKEKEPEYKTKESSGTETQSSIERGYESGMFINTSDSNSNADKTRDAERIAASTDDEKKSSSIEARNNIVSAKGLPKKKIPESKKPKPANSIARFVRKKAPLNSPTKNSPAAQKELEAANNITRFVRRKQEHDLVAAGRNRDSNSNNDDDDDKGGAS
jgi:murein DD-endopeptidase MepM/ murein hydrolase activator NlpD/type IV secretory pathway VirB6-like protein